ncbi:MULTISPECIES: zinc finger protein [Saccharothrix]|uniref:zinc finger protein n=1 Tax=Saccharothrix TaxID=2071 RepID=UPI0009F859F5|nr:zinc finger protein [Saccharothrix sp. CB00851]
MISRCFVVGTWRSTVGTRAFRWFPHDGYRHALDDTLVPGDTGSTLCGESVVIPRTPQPAYPNWCWPTCATCDASWREHEGIPAFPCVATSVKRPGASHHTSAKPYLPETERSAVPSGPVVDDVNKERQTDASR